MIHRREMLAQMCAMTALLGVLHRPAMAASGGAAQRAAMDWVARIDELTALLRRVEITEADWRGGLSQLFSEVDLSDLLRAIDFGRLRKEVGYAEKGVATANIRLATNDVRRLTFFPKLFALDKGRAIIPHGHENMMSAHLTLSGRMHLRQYDQLDRDNEALLIRQSIDRVVTAGHLASIGTVWDNVHWFVAEAPSHTFDVIVTGLEDGAEKPFDIFNLDMENAAPQTDGSMVAPILGVKAALAKYG